MISSDQDKKIMPVQSGDAGKRLDAFLASNLDGFSRAQIQKVLQSGSVSIDGHTCVTKNRRLKEGESVEATVPDIAKPGECEVIPEDITLDIVYEDNNLLVVNKPKDMVVHPGAGNITGTLANALLHHCGSHLSTLNDPMRPGIVHRIDKDTSGLLVVAKTNLAHTELEKQFFSHSVTREYTALVRDNIKADRGTIDMPIGRDTHDRKKRAVNGISPREAVTQYEVLERFGRYTLIKCVLETGRTHQIRVHMAYIKHPVACDPVYGSSKRDFAVRGQLLHAGLLGFIHPVSGKYMEFRVPLPYEFSHILDVLRCRQQT